MIIVTGGCGFIGSNLIKNLNKKKINDIFIVDSLTSLKKNNLKNLRYKKIISKKIFLNLLKFRKILKKLNVYFTLALVLIQPIIIGNIFMKIIIGILKNY